MWKIGLGFVPVSRTDSAKNFPVPDVLPPRGALRFVCTHVALPTQVHNPGSRVLDVSNGMRANCVCAPNYARNGPLAR